MHKYIVFQYSMSTYKLYIIKLFRLQTTINKLNTQLNNIHKRTRVMSDSTVSNVLIKLSESQKIIINEIITRSKVDNPKNRRYTED